jgi:hypothetical protein
MIPLASGIEPKLIFVVVAAIVGVINWLIEKKKKDHEATNSPTQTPPRPQQPAAQGQGGTDEQERLRRFMESLGVPQPAQAQRPQPAPAPAIVFPRQQPQISRHAAQPTEQRMKSPKPGAKARAKAMPRPLPVREPEEMQRAGRIEEAASSIEKISGEFSAINVNVTMDPLNTPDRPAHLASGAAGTTSITERDINPLIASVRRLLQKPADLRGAFVAMEILGPPRGLQR